VETQKVAIIGLGRIGSAFLSNMLARSGRGVELVAVAETGDTPGRQQAVAEGLFITSLDEILALGDGIDILFDLTGIPAIRREIREKLMAQRNHHTVVASESIARLLWVMTTEDELPLIEGRSTGY